MKKFSVFNKEKKNRNSHFLWSDGDLVTVESLDEWTAEKPLKHKTNMFGVGYLSTKDKKHDPNHHEFEHHGQKLSTVQREHMQYYKRDSYSTNHLLRHGHFDSEDASYRNPAHTHNHIHHMDKVTGHPTEHHHMTFRGGIPSDVHKFKPGHKFQDHGYTGTSFSHSQAANFVGKEKTHHRGKQILHVIHSPPGTKAHFIDSHANTLDHEQELVLHRGTKFKVTHHSEDEHRHYIHSRVVSQNPKKIPQGIPSKHHSVTEHAEHEASHGVTMTKHEDPKLQHIF